MIQHGLEDRVTDPNTSRLGGFRESAGLLCCGEPWKLRKQLYNEAIAKDKTLKLYDGVAWTLQL